MRPTFFLAIVFGLGAIMGLSIIVAIVPKSFSPDSRWMWAAWVFALAAVIAARTAQAFYGGRLKATFAGVSVALLTMILSPIPGMIYIGIEKEGAVGGFQGLIFGIAAGFYGVLFFGLLIAPVGALLGLIARFLVLRRPVRSNATA